MVQTEGGEELLEFFENINQFHDTIMFTMGWSRHSINYLDVQVIETTVSVTNVVTHNHICPSPNSMLRSHSCLWIGVQKATGRSNIERKAEEKNISQ